MIAPSFKAFTDELVKLAWKKTCSWCSLPAERWVVWADGRAVAATCMDHLGKAKKLDSVVKIKKAPSWEKNAGVMQNVGDRVVHTAKMVPGALLRLGHPAPPSAGFAQGVSHNIGQAVSAFSTPIKSMQRGWNDTGWTMAGEKYLQTMANDPEAGRLTKFFHRHAQFFPGGKTMTLLGGAADLPNVTSKEDRSGRNRSRLARGAAWAGTQAGGLIGSPFGMSGGLVGAGMGNAAGNAVGSMVDRVTGHRRKIAPPMVQEKKLKRSPKK